ncbi:MAG: hypothetical protein CFK52_14810 [Chloracidobacterium sp. CP2_5A]|nr:MAG: hypothetical protein CFK52_14810 [Chloracidobacterium sp. CP2_5A]
MVEAASGDEPMKSPMDLVSAVVGFKQAELSSRVQIAVAKRLLDLERLQGASAVKLIEAAGQVATKGDALVAAATGLGGELDVRA